MGYLNLDSGPRIYYERLEGDAGCPWLIFLHEGLGCIPMWGAFPRELCRRTGCPGLVYDRSGYGRSSALDAARTIHYMHDYALGELPGVIQALIPGKPFILVGHSDGGSIGLIYGAQRPPLLKGIVSEAAHVFVEPETIEGIRRADKAFDQGKFQRLYTYHGDKTRQIFKAWSDTWQTEWFRHWNIQYLLPSITCPVLVIQGDKDPYGSPDQVAAIQSGVRGQADPYFVENCGHAPHSEQPEPVLGKISGFTEKIKGCP